MPRLVLLNSVGAPLSYSQRHFAFDPKIKGRDGSVGIATRYGMDGRGIESRWGARFSGPGAHPASYTMGKGSLLGVKRPGRGVDHPPHLVPKLKKE